MSVYLGKLLELISIDITSNQSFLRIRLLSEQEIEFLWEIDIETAENLKAVTVFDGLHKYRLSFHSTWDSTQNKYTSFLTKTYLDQSHKVYFSCSEAFVNELHALKYNEETLQKNNFTIIPDSPTATQYLEKNNTTAKRNSLNLLSWKTGTLLLSIVFIFLLSTAFLNQEETTGNAKVKDSTIKKEATLNLAKKDNLVTNADIVDETTSSIDVKDDELMYPFVKLDEIVNYSIPEGKVALTFDDGPSKYTKDITDILKNYQVGGTFFFIGNNVKRYSDSVKYVKSHGYSIGGHSMTHPDLAKIPYHAQENEIIHTNQLIEEITQEEVVLFRPPYGSKNEETIEIMNETNNKIVLWNADTEDWKSQNGDEIFSYIRGSKSSGSIILLHESQIVVDILPEIIEYLKEQELEIVTLY
ncbi:polysaccharide deacetylase family protein [Psychrobacillus vulpis]|uniref:Polysaccharide deacetylase family protein n=1 Tax=Psychrobacillus vulpis TaxID=2325572 RepID=A0A544TTT3_9BACI|nr:polysaccharide deacetylase family protein [Psychrobacillus vulpis]TQR20834.1 polysaccharide deacetylase family protein [Psychrobacillus vulpis]